MERNSLMRHGFKNELMSTHMDKNVENVVKQLRDREEEGMRKYGVNTERTDLTTLQWLQHLQEELMDASVYIEKLKNEIEL